MLESTRSASFLTFELEEHPVISHALISVDASAAKKLYDQTAHFLQSSVRVTGFSKGNVPLEYVKKNFSDTISTHLYEFLLKYCVTNFLHRIMRERKIIIVGNPRLHSIKKNKQEEICFHFEISIFHPPRLSEWRHLPFKAPKRKKYKDLDRQIEQFVAKERETIKSKSNEIIAIGDWIQFVLSVTDEQHNTIFGNYIGESFWLRLGEEEADTPLHDIFIGKKQGDQFHTNQSGLQEYFGGEFGAKHSFIVKIIDHSPCSFFCFDQFKKQFRIKNNKEMLRKLIEIVSYRNDVSQRRLMVDGALKLLMSKHPFSPAQHFIVGQKKAILHAVKNSPDYHVYRTQANFNQQMEELAEKQIKEMILLDQLAYHENLQLSDNDVKNYLNLLKRPRTKEFCYFDPPSSTVDCQEVLLPNEELKRLCLREKTINFIIYHLTKQ